MAFFQTSLVSFNLLPTLSFHLPLRFSPYHFPISPFICHCLLLSLSKFSGWSSLGRGCWGSRPLASSGVYKVLPLSNQDTLGEVETQCSKTDAPCQRVTEVKAGDKLGRGTHTSQHPAFNDLYRTTVAWGVSKLNKRKFPSYRDATLSPDYLSKVQETWVHHCVEEGWARRHECITVWRRDGP